MEEQEKQPIRDVVITPQQLTPEVWTMITKVAPVMATAAMFGVTPARAMAVMVKGHELGLGLAASFEYIHIIQNKPSLSPRGALALIYNHPEFAGIEIEDTTDNKGEPQSCTVTMKRKNGFSYTTTYAIADAARAGLLKDKSGWDKYPANMLRWRAIGYCADIVFPDACGGLRRADEYGADVDTQGTVIEGSWDEVPDVSAELRSQELAEAGLKPEVKSDDLLQQVRIIRDRMGDAADITIAGQISQQLSIPVPVAMGLLKQIEERIF